MSTLNIPPQCNGQGSACIVVQPYLASGQCEPRNCCTDIFGSNMEQCLICIGGALHLTNFTEPQTTLDQFVQWCATMGTPIEKITLPGQDPNRPLNIPSFTASTSTPPTSTFQSAPTNTLSSTSDAARPTTSKPPAGIIAGAVTGGVAFITLVIVCLLLLLRRRRDRKPGPLPVESTVSPFLDNNTRSEWVDEKRPGSTRSESMRPESMAPRPESMKQRPGSVSQQSEVASSTKDAQTVSVPAESTVSEIQYDSEENSIPSSSRRTTRIIQHDDSGWRPAQVRSPSPVEEEPSSPIGSVEVVEMPPQYEEAL
ncbi:hypothetical protein Moror_1584 [Moniliophthora roreri MCA 2997]|uniref:Uncharacterized protein n=2 Tax=Moniliophthora roreri TaxID=221103 RepID=V2X361_MONRO|nr:hypothetical protein Moror_1584 [Moniliophthora roreri MCA 2997]KAI3611013.1 hypothetical protein WG66_013776 [Moniliophthora roreri]